MSLHTVTPRCHSRVTDHEIVSMGCTTAGEGRGGFGTCEIWNSAIWCRENLAPTLNTAENFGTEFPHCRTTSIDCEWWWLISYGPLVGSCHFLEPWRANCVGTGGMCIPRAPTMTPEKMATDLKIQWHKLAHFGSAKYCCSKFRLFQIPPPLVKLATPRPSPLWLTNLLRLTAVEGRQPRPVATY